MMIKQIAVDLILGELKRYSQFKSKVEAILENIQVPMMLYAATANDLYRKPRTSMWQEFVRHSESKGITIDQTKSFFVGDAAGRAARRDHSCSDRKMAANIGLKFFTPEEFFLGLKSEPYSFGPFDPIDFLQVSLEAEARYERKNERDIVLFVGCPGVGKSTYSRNLLEPLGYQRINQDTLKTKVKCLSVARKALEAKQSVVVDNTNADKATRAAWVALAQEFNVPIRCLHFTSSIELARHNNLVRALAGHSVVFANLLRSAATDSTQENRELLPTIAFNGYKKRFELPTEAEGFQDVIDIRFVCSPDAGEVWKRWWE